MNGFYKVEVIHKDGPWRSIEQVELATLDWVDWYNNKRIMEPLEYIHPQEFKMMYFEQETCPALNAGLT